MAIAAGSVDAFADLYERHRVLVYSIAFKVTNDRSIAEDATQDAFLAVWRSAGQYVDARGSVKTWLVAIVHHRSVDIVRRRQVRELPGQDAFTTPPQLVTPDPWREVSGHLDAVAVHEALRQLKPAQREALELGYLGGMSQSEVAARTRTPLGTVKSRMRLGLRAMRRAFESSEADSS
ncbi:MAG: sigma-70 family RNA polymerase sigma factor [Chloroflexi bacterium]|nr:sigma-70 family RNA polymerase sigma factor [Chloroflexota bacterium]